MKTIDIEIDIEGVTFKAECHYQITGGFRGNKYTPPEDPEISPEKLFVEGLDITELLNNDDLVKTVSEQILQVLTDQYDDYDGSTDNG